MRNLQFYVYGKRPILIRLSSDTDTSFFMLSYENEVSIDSWKGEFYSFGLRAKTISEALYICNPKRGVYNYEIEYGGTPGLTMVAQSLLVPDLNWAH